MVYTTGTPLTSAQIRFYVKGEWKVKQIKKGDELTDIMVALYPNQIKGPSATVAGFTLRSLTVPRHSTAVYDCVPTYHPDVKGDHHYGLVEEVASIDTLLLELPAEEGKDPKRRVVKLDKLVSFEGGEDIEPGSEDDETGTPVDSTGCPICPPELGHNKIESETSGGDITEEDGELVEEEP